MPCRPQVGVESPNVVCQNDHMRAIGKPKSCEPLGPQVGVDSKTASLVVSESNSMYLGSAATDGNSVPAMPPWRCETEGRCCGFAVSPGLGNNFSRFGASIDKLEVCRSTTGIASVRWDRGKASDDRGCNLLQCLTCV